MLGQGIVYRRRTFCALTVGLWLGCAKPAQHGADPYVAPSAPNSHNSSTLSKDLPSTTLPPLAPALSQQAAIWIEIAKWNEELCHKTGVLRPAEAYAAGVFDRTDSDERPTPSGQDQCRAPIDHQDAHTARLIEVLRRNVTSTPLLDDGEVRLAEALIRRPNLLQIRDGEGRTLLHHFAMTDDLRLMKDLMAWGYSIELWQDDKWQRLPLHYARSAEMAELIWRQSPSYRRAATYIGFYGSMESHRDAFGATPLITMARSGSGLAVRFLLSKICRTLPSWAGRHIDFAGDVVDFALHLGGRLEDTIEEDLVNIADLQGRTALHAAALANDPVGADALASCFSVDLHRIDKSNRTALHYAAAHTSFEAGEPIAHQILSGNANKLVDVNIRDINGDTALHLGYRCQNTTGVQFLKTLKADESLINSRGYRPHETSSIAEGCPEFK
jgi:hypothetical protein